MDLEELKRLAASTLAKAIGDILGNVSADVEKFGEELAGKLVEYASTNNTAGVTITLARIQMLGERHRIKVNDTAWDTLNAISKALFRFLVGVIKL